MELHTSATEAQFFKVDESQRLIIGWAIVSKIDGKDHFDLQGDHIPEASMLKAAKDFMKNSRVAKEMHQGDPIGNVVFAFPMTTDIAKSLNITTGQTGLLLAIEPEDDEMLEKARLGEFTGFSIGGSRIEDEEIDDE